MATTIKDSQIPCVAAERDNRDKLQEVAANTSKESQARQRRHSLRLHQLIMPLLDWGYSYDEAKKRAEETLNKE